METNLIALQVIMFFYIQEKTDNSRFKTQMAGNTLFSPDHLKNTNFWLTGEEYNFTTIIDVPSLDTAIEEANKLAEKYNAKIKFIDNIHSRSFKSRYESNSNYEKGKSQF